MMLFIVIICLFLTPVFANYAENITSNPCTDQNHLVLVPGVLTGGGSSRACVSRFYPDGPAKLLLTLNVNGETVTSTRQLNPGDGGCLDISVPLQPNTKAELSVNIRYPEVGCTWERHLPIRISSGKLLVINSERARYRPGDSVRFRLLALKADLTPAHTTLDEVWLEGPRGAWEGSRLAQWSHVRTRLGVAQLQYQLDELSPTGKWTLRGRLADGTQGSAVFSVGNYDIPPFQLTVRHAPRILRTSERLVWTVCVRYPWSEAVEGMLVIRIRGAGSSGGIRTATRIRAPRACHRHAAAARRIGLLGDNPPDVIVADFSFQEEGTRVWQNTTVVSEVVDNPVTLEFLTRQRTVISSGLPYKLKVKAIRWDDKPASNENIRICKSAAKSLEKFIVDNSSCIESLTDDKGITRVMFTANGGPYYAFQATCKNASTSLQLIVGSSTGRAALGPLRAQSSAKTLVPLYVNLDNVIQPLTVHFVVITRGGIIYRWGATTQCPSSSDQILTANRNSNCENLRNKPGNIGKTFDSFQNFAVGSNTTDAMDSLLDGKLLKIMLPIKVTHQMCPDSHLVAYFYYNNELISASKHLEMDECFANKVEATWSNRQTAPGSMASLHLSTPGPALCALSVLDTASKWIQPGETIRDLIMKSLRKLIDGHRNMTEYDAAGECFFSSEELSQLPSSNLAEMWLSNAGVRLLGGKTFRKQCDTPPALLTADDNLLRSDFSESWLWKLVMVGANGSVLATARAPDSITRFEASAFCVSKTGIAISQPAVLQVFREFFIHADASRKLRSGDETVLRYRLFNYLYQPLSVQVEIITGPHLEAINEDPQPACIQGRSSIGRRVKVIAKRPGAAFLSIRASTAQSCNETRFTYKQISDEVVVQIQVDPEGVPIQEHKSIMLCDRDVPGSVESKVHWNWTRVDVVPGTESVTVWAASDITGPLLADADALVLLPRGCGEQNMARLATNLLALAQLHPNSPAAYTAKDHVARGFARQLQYVHTSGGFSAFGSSDLLPSTWLTAFSVRYLRRAHQVISPGQPIPRAVETAEKWLLSQQMENGCFRNEGQVFHRELKGGLNEDGEIASVTLTAYVITSLIESTIPIPHKVIQNSLSCLRALPPKKNPSRAYAYSIITYAFMRLRRYERDLKQSNEATSWGLGLEIDEEMRELVGLLKMAKRSGNYVWWESGSLATSIEATGYALLALSECMADLRNTCASDATRATLWLATHTNAAGGFVSTQDTLVALEGLTTWSSIVPANSSLSVRVASGVVSKTVAITSSSKLPEVIKLPIGDVDVTVDGTGCALVQATRQYNTLKPDEKQNKLLKVQVDVQTDGTFNCDGNNTCFCAAIVEVCAEWSGIFPEMALIEISLPGGFGAETKLLYQQQLRTNTLLRRIEVSANNGRVTLYLGSRNDDTSRGGHQCYKIHAVGPKAKTKPAYAKILDYYRPEINDIQMYSVPEECRSRISDDTKDMLLSENIFNKARSINGDILINYDFSFEDIPEGFPLEDPLYDNLTQRNKDENSNITIDSENEILGADDLKYQKKYTEETHDKINEETLTMNDSINVPANVEIDTNKARNIESKRDLFDYNSPETKPNNIELFNVDSQTDNNENKGKAEEINVMYNGGVASDESDKHNIQDSEDNSNIKQNAQFQAIKSEQETTSGSEFKEDSNKDTDPFANFHVIDSEKDLDVPTGIEGPVPSIVLPPDNFFANSGQFQQFEQRRKLYSSPTYFIQPYYNHQYYRNIRTI
ncbi:alpha-2-macroglobulin-like protein 1 [Pieris rapae]|uniref:alpha-2-macroglobulin-like protein 1 n=1 Tax=Pieris rapae TaxID=64459 RepID=UPI001E27B8BF|nr:alpha-2-macroglobulin-like protein 1 [Pieris rapae]